MNQNINMKNFQEIVQKITEHYNIQSSLDYEYIRRNNEDEYLDYLNKTYPHGYFVQKFQEINMLEHVSVQLKSSVIKKVAPTLTSRSKSTTRKTTTLRRSSQRRTRRSATKKLTRPSVRLDRQRTLKK
jgi:hypothetical protein